MTTDDRDELERKLEWVKQELQVVRMIRDHRRIKQLKAYRERLRNLLEAMKKSSG